jgi:pectate lyase
VPRSLILVLAAGLATSGAAACADAKVYPYVHPTPPKECPSVKLGFAAVGGDVDGVATQPTTGGGDGDAPFVIVKDAGALAMAIQRPDPLVIYVDGMLTATDTIKVTVDRNARGGNKTVIGLGDYSGITGAGFDLSYTDNVIIRNLKISKAAVGEGDAITILAAHHIWIDHCDLSSDPDDTTSGYDGLVDITHGSSFITVSWNNLHDHRDTSLVGHTSDPAQKTEDAALTVTYHHNAFIKVYSGPRVRWGFAHVYNNRFQSVMDFGVVSESEALVNVGHNVFEDVHMPIATHYQDPTDGTMLEEGDQFTPAFSVDIMRPTTAVAPIPYSFNPDDVESVKTLVPSCTGTGKITLLPP